MTAAVVAGIALLYLLQIQTVHRALDSQLRAYVEDIADTSADGRWPTFLPASNLDGNAEAQVISADGRVLAATRTLAGVPPVYALPTDASTPIRLEAANGIIPTDVRVVGIRRAVAGHQVSIIAGTSTSLLTNLRSAFTSNLLIGFPLILLAAGLGVWLIVGRALRPVDRIRNAVTDITSADLSQRVPEPGTADEIGDLAHTMNDMLGRLENSAHRQRGSSPTPPTNYAVRSPQSAPPSRSAWPIPIGHRGQRSQSEPPSSPPASKISSSNCCCWREPTSGPWPTSRSTSISARCSPTCSRTPPPPTLTSTCQSVMTSRRSATPCMSRDCSATSSTTRCATRAARSG